MLESNAGDEEPHPAPTQQQEPKVEERNANNNYEPDYEPEFEPEPLQTNQEADVPENPQVIEQVH
jgi:hypothetical protein